MSADPFGTLARRQRTLIKNALERQALDEARHVLDDRTLTDDERVSGATQVLASYAVPYTRLLQQEAMAS